MNKEKEFFDKQKQFNQNGGFEKFTEHFEKYGNVLSESVSKLMDEQIKLSKPQSKKDVSINENSCAINLISDGRVIINFSTLDEGKLFYDEFEKYKHEKIFQSSFKEIYNKNFEEKHSLNMELNLIKSKWWYKLFSK